MPDVKNHQIDPRRFSHAKPDDWSIIDPSDGLPADGDFGYDFFTKLLSKHMDLRDDMVCFRYAAQPEDTWVIFDRQQSPFGVQLDPALDYIIIFDSQIHNEVGPWFDDPTQNALDFIQNQFIQAEPAT